MTTRDEILHDPVAAALGQATALRLLHHYRHALEKAALHGADLSELPQFEWRREIADRYARVLDSALPECAENGLQAKALHQFAAFALIDEEIGTLSGWGTLDDQNRGQALRALLAIGDFMNRVEIDEAVERERKLPLPADSFGARILDEVRSALDRVAGGAA